MDRADAVIEITEWVEVPKKNLTVENSTIASPTISVEVGEKNSSEESSANLHVEDAGTNNTSNSGEEQSATDLGTERKLKKRTFRVPLKVQISDCAFCCFYPSKKPCGALIIKGIFYLIILFCSLFCFLLVDFTFMTYRLLRRQWDLQCHFQKSPLLKLKVN